jgi:hypothetical protein
MDIEAMLVNDVFVEWPENHNRLGRRQAQAIAIRPLRGQGGAQSRFCWS